MIAYFKWLSRSFDPFETYDSGLFPTRQFRFPTWWSYSYSVKAPL